MTGNERRKQIQELVNQRGFVTIEALAAQFAVTPQTIRRDINALCDDDLLRRYHGGAGLPSSVENDAYTTRQTLHSAEKQDIAKLVAHHIPEESSLFINIGTTTESVARALLNHQRLTVITNNLNVANILSAKENFEVIIAGGKVRSRDRGIVGEATMDFIGQFKVDYAVIGISGIDLDGTMLDFDYREVRVAQAIMAHSRHVFLVTDHSKFGRNAMVRLANIADIDALFTDQEPPSEIREIADSNGVAIRVAG